MAKRDKRIPTSSPSGLTSNPFASLAPAGGAEADPEPDPAADPEVADDPCRPERAVIRYQRKGRGGKEVTLVELRGVPAGELDGWLSSLRRELGCGGFLEDGQLALSGDQRARLRAVLEHRGVTRISVG